MNRKEDLNLSKSTSDATKLKGFLYERYNLLYYFFTEVIL